MPHVVDEALLREMLRGPNGAVARDMLRRGLKVENAAKRNLGSSPKRVDTGRLRASITHQMIITRMLVMRVGTNVTYAPFVHDGTGIYGPRGAMILPVNRTVLRWKTRGRGRGRGGYVYAKRSRGMAPNPFLKNALKAARG